MEKPPRPHDENYEIRKPERVEISPYIAKLLLWGAGIVFLVVIFMTLRDSLWSFSRSRRLQREGEEHFTPSSVAERMGKVQLEAEELVRQGSFTEAMHMLLLQSVIELRGYLGITIAASLTSREILQCVALSPEGKAGFADIVGRVEISWFGPHKPGEEEYLACRKSYEILEQALRQGRVI